MRSHYLYSTWYNMLFRCNNIKSPSYKSYGKRGIKVCKRWEDMKNFVKDMGDRPEGMTLDRVDNNKGYSKKNCKWSTKQEQQRNTTRNRFIEHKGETYCLTEWSQRLGIGRDTLSNRLNTLNWSVDKAFGK